MKFVLVIALLSNVVFVGNVRANGRDMTYPSDLISIRTQEEETAFDKWAQSYHLSDFLNKCAHVTIAESKVALKTFEHEKRLNQYSVPSESEDRTLDLICTYSNGTKSSFFSTPLKVKTNSDLSGIAHTDLNRVTLGSDLDSIIGLRIFEDRIQTLMSHNLQQQ